MRTTVDDLAAALRPGLLQPVSSCRGDSKAFVRWRGYNADLPTTVGDGSRRSVRLAGLGGRCVVAQGIREVVGRCFPTFVWTGRPSSNRWPWAHPASGPRRPPACPTTALSGSVCNAGCAIGRPSLNPSARGRPAASPQQPRSWAGGATSGQTSPMSPPRTGGRGLPPQPHSEGGPPSTDAHPDTPAVGDHPHRAT